MFRITEDPSSGSLVKCLAKITSMVLSCPLTWTRSVLWQPYRKALECLPVQWTTHTHLLTYLLTHSMEQSPSWEANRFSSSQEIPLILWNPKVHHCIHKSPPPVPILRRFDPLHISKSHFLKINFNIIPPSTPGFPKWSLSFRFPHQNPVYASHLPLTHYMPRPSRSSRF